MQVQMSADGTAALRAQVQHLKTENSELLMSAHAGEGLKRAKVRLEQAEAEMVSVELTWLFLKFIFIPEHNCYQPIFISHFNFSESMIFLAQKKTDCFATLFPLFFIAASYKIMDFPCYSGVIFGFYVMFLI